MTPAGSKAVDGTREPVPVHGLPRPERARQLSLLPGAGLPSPREAALAFKEVTSHSLHVLFRCEKRARHAGTALGGAGRHRSVSGRPLTGRPSAGPECVTAAVGSRAS